MATDPPWDARRPIPDPDDTPSDLVAQLHRYSRSVIEAELRRLARRNPSLRPDDLRVIDAALDELVESLLLARLRSLPQHTARLKHLFTPEGRAHQPPHRGLARRTARPARNGHAITVVSASDDGRTPDRSSGLRATAPTPGARLR